MTDPTTRPRHLSNYDMNLIEQIAVRAKKELEPLGMSIDMYRAGLANLFVCHGGYCPMNLEFMLAADLPNLAHDFCEIAKKGGPDGFRDFFSPRMSADNNPRTPAELTPEEVEDEAHVAEWVSRTYQTTYYGISRVAQEEFKKRFEEAKH